MNSDFALDSKGFNLIWVSGIDEETGDFMIMNPKNLIDLNLNKAVGSLEWTNKTLTSDYKCFIYDPSKISIFNEDGSQNRELIKLFVGTLAGENKDD